MPVTEPELHEYEIVFRVPGSCVEHKHIIAGRNEAAAREALPAEINVGPIEILRARPLKMWGAPINGLPGLPRAMDGRR